MTSLTSVATRHRQLTVVGVVGFAAMMALGAQIAIPIPGTPVPFTLQPLAVVLAGLCLGPVAGAASMVLYLLVGALGAPVFSPIGAPGVLRLIGPTGGYLLAAPAAAAIAGLVGRRFPAFAGRMLAAFLGIATLYLGGVAQLLVQWIALANFIAPRPCPDTRLAGDERFPVVDQNDEFLRDASRSDVHGNNLRHRAVHILIFNSAGEVYLQQRSRWKDRHPLKWDSSAAGHVGATESYDETAQRELEEELGISVRLEKISKLPASECTDQEFVWLYRGDVAGNVSPNRTEIEAGGFFPETIVDGWAAARPEDFAPGFIECWKVYRRKNCNDCGALT